MVRGYVCSVCAMRMDENQNETGLTNVFGQVVYLCTRHHEAGRIVLETDGEFNWFAMVDADRALEDERPPLNDAKAWASWDPVARTVELYRTFVKRESNVRAQTEAKALAAAERR